MNVNNEISIGNFWDKKTKNETLTALFDAFREAGSLFRISALKKYTLPLKRVFTIFGVSVFLFMLMENSAFTANEYWVSTNTNSGNLGTLDNPFICADASSFDSIMGALPPNSTIHILPGTYQTEGLYGWYIKTGQKILGSGIDITTLQLASGAPSGDFVVGSHLGTNMVVSDLTADDNYTSGINTYGGIQLDGTQLTVSRVKVINLAYYDESVNSEVWGIAINAFGYGSTIQSKKNLIEYCEVSHFQGGSAISAIAFNGSPTNSISGIMHGNRVYLPTDMPFACYAFNGAYTQGWSVENNFVHGGSAAFYGDTGDYSNVVVAHNLFENCYFGALLLSGNRTQLTFSYNTILLNPGTNTYYHNDAFFFYPTSGSVYANINITGNSVDFSGATISGMTYNFLNAADVVGLTVIKNTFNPLLVGHLLSCTAVDLKNNMGLNGDILTNFDQIELP